MQYIQVVPDQLYFVWQLYVQMQNFMEYGIEQDAVILVAITRPDGQPSKEMKAFEKWTTAKVYYYEDTRESKRYISSIRPHILAKHFSENQCPEVIFYHDQDIIWLQEPKLSHLEAGEMNYVAAEAHSYLHTGYMKRFKGYIFPSMCEIVGVKEKTVIDNDPHCGGAQYILKGTDAAFWKQVEIDCEALFAYCEDICKDGLRKYNPKQELESYQIQYWCSDMWALLWNLLKNGKEYRHAAEIDFSWPWETYDKAKPIMHNAGITDKTRKVNKKITYFYKSGYTSKTPFGEDFSYVPETSVQSAYTKLIKAVDALGVAS